MLYGIIDCMRLFYHMNAFDCLEFMWWVNFIDFAAVRISIRELGFVRTFQTSSQLILVY